MVAKVGVVQMKVASQPRATVRSTVDLEFTPGESPSRLAAALLICHWAAIQQVARGSSQPASSDPWHRATEVNSSATTMMSVIRRPPQSQYDNC